MSGLYLPRPSTKFGPRSANRSKKRGYADGCVQALGPGPAVVLGVISGIGGGIIRDVLAGKRISIFDGEVYALAAVAGSVAFLLTQSFGEWVPFLTGVSVILIIRLGAVALGWQVPTLPMNSPHSREN